MPVRSRLAVSVAAAVASLAVMVAIATTDDTGARRDATMVVAAPAPQPTETSVPPAPPGDEPEVAGKVVQRPQPKRVVDVPPIEEMPRTGTVTLLRRAAVGLVLLGAGLLCLDRAFHRLGRARRDRRA